MMIEQPTLIPSFYLEAQMDKLSTKLRRFFFKEQIPEYITLGDVLFLAEDRIFGFLFIALASPCTLPVLHFGLAAPMGLMIACTDIQMGVGIRFPWLPRRLLNHPVKFKVAQRISGVGIAWLRRLEQFSMPRLSFICTSWVGRLLIGGVILIAAFAMIVPVSGTIPNALGVLITGVGLLEEDGVTSMIGMLVCLLASAITVTLFFALGFGGFSLIEFLRR